MNDSNFDYDVALSFAGEDRNYIDIVANYLKNNNIRIFYDQYENVQLWGVNLYEHLHDVYSNKARYCVIFISKYYEQKVWPNHELRSVQERALIDRNEYILPARFDDTKLPGLPSTISYIDLRDITPEKFADLIIQKLASGGTNGTKLKEPEFRVPHVQSKNLNQYDEAILFIDFLKKELTNRAKVLQEVNASLTSFINDGKTCFRIVHEGNTVYSLNVWMGGMFKDAGLSFYGTSGEIRSSQNSTNAWGEMIWDKERDEVVLKLNDMSLLSYIPGQEKLLSPSEFVNLIWDRIIDEVEK